MRPRTDVQVRSMPHLTKLEPSSVAKAEDFLPQPVACTPAVVVAAGNKNSLAERLSSRLQLKAPVCYIPTCRKPSSHSFVMAPVLIVALLAEVNKGQRSGD